MIEKYKLPDKYKIPDYIVLSPVGDHRTKCLDEFIKSIKSFKPPPKEIVFCVDVDTELKWDYEGITIKYSPEISVYRSYLERICSAREILRNHFIYGKYKLALWIDSDIIAPPETPSEMYKAMVRRKNLVIVNKYPGRNESDGYWCGSGLMLTDKHACTLSRFWVGRIELEDGKFRNISEDFIFFALFDQSEGIQQKILGRSGRSCNEFVKVKHYLDMERITPTDGRISSNE